MKKNANFSVVRRDEENYLVNIEDGDVYYINDVTLDILDSCEQFESQEKLCDFIYDKYSGEGDYSKEELQNFIKEMIDNGILE